MYSLSEPGYDGRWTVPVLFDKVQKKIVSNESSEIIRMLGSEFNEFCETVDQRELDIYPKELRKEIDEMNDWVYPYVLLWYIARRHFHYNARFLKLSSSVTTVIIKQSPTIIANHQQPLIAWLPTAFTCVTNH